jgi:hypothetical protein
MLTSPSPAPPPPPSVHDHTIPSRPCPYLTCWSMVYTAAAGMTRSTKAAPTNQHYTANGNHARCHDPPSPPLAPVSLTCWSMVYTAAAGMMRSSKAAPAKSPSASSPAVHTPHTPHGKLHHHDPAKRQQHTNLMCFDLGYESL